MPWALPIPPTRTTAAPIATAPPVEPMPPEHDACLADAGTQADCRAALEKLGHTATHRDRIHDIYKRACDKKAKLLGCGAFKSTAITEADRPSMDQLMVCEAGQPEVCEDVKTRSAPLMAWLSTLKTDGCKKGDTALCANYKECKKGAQWSCVAPTGAVPVTPSAPGSPAPAPAADAQVCGCVPKCPAGQPIAIATGRTWPDNSKRGAFTCSAAP